MLSSVGILISRQVAKLMLINSACVVGPTQQRNTLTYRVAIATSRITARGILRHGKWKSSDYSLLAQFGLTPKSKRGLASSDPTEPADPLDEL